MADVRAGHGVKEPVSLAAPGASLICVAPVKWIPHKRVITRREFSLTEGAARGTCGRLGPRGRDQRGLVTGTRCSNLGSGRGSR